MANVLNRQTCQYLQSVNTPDFNEADWIINPDLSQVSGIEEKYWKLVADQVVEMTIEEKAIVDGTGIPQASTLASGLPTYIRQGIRLGVSQTLLNFYAKAAGVKTFSLPYNGVKKQYHVAKRVAITSIEQDEDIHTLFTVNLSKNGSVVSTSAERNKDCLILLEVGDLISIQVTSTVKLTDPMVTLQIAERD